MPWCTEHAIDARATVYHGYALTVQSLYANGHGYRPGNRYAFGLGAASDAGTANWRFRVTLERASETAERWHGMVNTTEGNLGRVDVLAGVEAAYRISEDWRAALAVKLPLYTHVVGGQVDVPLFASLTISTHEHLWTPPHVHPPPVAAPGAHWSGLDERAAVSDGSVAPLVPVTGKLTVFDFWAGWCVPCHELDQRLAEVARRHPGALAVRKVNVIDDESAAWRAYLAPGGFNLPCVKLFGADGALLWEASGDPAALAARVEAALARRCCSATSSGSAPRRPPRRSINRCRPPPARCTGRAPRSRPRWHRAARRTSRTRPATRRCSPATCARWRTATSTR